MKLKLTAPASRSAYATLALVLVLYLAFLVWLKSWLGLLVVPFIYDTYITKNINWGWWREAENPVTRFVMGWVDALVFALVAIYFLNQFFFQNFVIPSSSLEKTLLTGDYLLVSKLSYGPRIPQTPLSMPLTQHTLPILNCRSYIEHPHWPYRRVEGLGKVKLNDIVVFNYPAGDTVALNVQNEDFYRLVYQCGDEALRPAPDILLSDSLKPSTPYAEQQALYRRIYAAGREMVRLGVADFGEVQARPVDRRENYVKRCVGLPGQTLLIKDNIIYLDGKPNREPDNSQYCYDVVFRSDLPDELKRELGITNEDLSQRMADEQGRMHVFMPLTRRALTALKGRPDIVESLEHADFLDSARWLYPQNMAKDWTTSNYGGPDGIWIPKKGETLRLTLDRLPIYERLIRNYEGNTLEVRDNKIFINGKQTDRYTFKMDYYWMQGDNRDNSADSRFWGFVPEDHVVGKPLFVWLSLDPDYGLFDGKVRWERIFKWVGDAR